MVITVAGKKIITMAGKKIITVGFSATTQQPAAEVCLGRDLPKQRWASLGANLKYNEN